MNQLKIIAAGTTLVTAAFGAHAACTGTNSPAGCDGSAASQTGANVAQASAQGGVGGNGGNIRVPAITLGIGSAATSADLGPGGCGVGGWEFNLGVYKKWGVEGDKKCMTEVAAAQARRQACLDGLKLAETGVINGSSRAQQLGNMGMTMAIQNCSGAAGAAQQTIDLSILCEEEAKKDNKPRKLDLFNRCVFDQDRMAEDKFKNDYAAQQNRLTDLERQNSQLKGQNSQLKTAVDSKPNCEEAVRRALEDFKKMGYSRQVCPQGSAWGPITKPAGDSCPTHGCVTPNGRVVNPVNALIIKN